jgi:hypothetical protein
MIFDEILLGEKGIKSLHSHSIWQEFQPKFMLSYGKYFFFLSYFLRAV